MTGKTQRIVYTSGSYAVVHSRFYGYGVVRVGANGRTQPAYSEPDPVTGRPRMVHVPLGDAFRMMQQFAREEYADAASTRMGKPR